VTHRHPDFWPDPERFDPDRFAHQDRRERHRCAYLPFGAGQRICIGEFMAQLEVKILIILILQRYALRLAPGFTQICRGFISLHPVTGMRVCYEERAAPAVVSLPQGAPTAEPLDRTPQGSHGA
jgi:cytochrome P450